MRKLSDRTSSENGEGKLTETDVVEVLLLKSRQAKQSVQNNVGAGFFIVQFGEIPEHAHRARLTKMGLATIAAFHVHDYTR